MNFCSLLLLQLPLLLVFTTTSKANIPPGSSLYASNTSQTWSSPNNTFFLGFTQVDPTSYTVSISHRTAGVSIWTTANVVVGTASAAVIDYGGVFQFLPNGNLLLTNRSGATVWTSNTANLGVTSASLDDTGNLVLKAGRINVWSSFENPTDTLVPSQNLTVNQTLRSGVYSFRLLSSGNMSLTWNDSVVYWNQGFSSALKLTPPTLQLQSNGILTLLDAGSRMSVAFGNDYGEGGEIMRFLRLGSDGNLRMYSGGTTAMTWAALADQCQVYGYCGNMGICSYNESSLSPICKCPSLNFEAVDVNDSRKGCKRKVEVADCAGNVTMLELKQTKFLTFQAQQIVTIGITACRVNCLSSPSCMACTSTSDTYVLYCYMKNTPDFVSGYQGPVLLGTSYIKVCGPVQPNPLPSDQIGGDKKFRESRGWQVGVFVAGTLLGLAALVGLFWWFRCKNSPKFGGVWAQYTLLDYASGAPVQFSYKDLHRWTKGFKDKLGAGGFGAVYRGVLANRTVVAAKQLEGIEQGERQFRMEVATISSTHHLNLVRLIGFCSEGRHRLLVYEFMKNGSLDHFLFTTEDQSGKLLNWKRRFNIALGTARGITYLHEECRDCIVHCDIKPENILLDVNFNAKVSDFGLAKLISTKDQRYRSLTTIRGTRGYLAPEWLANLPITSKSDLYSYGMVLLELVSGRRNFEVSEEINQKRFSEWAYGEFEKGNVETIVDKRLADQGVDMEQVTRAVQVSFWCIQEHPSQRPTMGKVVQMLEGIVEIARPPAPKALMKGSTSGTSTNLSSQDGAQSTSEASAPPPSSSSSFQTAGISPVVSERIMERPYPSVLELFEIKSH